MQLSQAQSKSVLSTYVRVVIGARVFHPGYRICISPSSDSMVARTSGRRMWGCVRRYSCCLSFEQHR